MSGETNLQKLLQNMQPRHNAGDYVFCTVPSLDGLSLKDIVLYFKEDEGFTIVIQQQLADELNLTYSLIAAWITLTVNSSLAAVGLTAAFTGALAAAGISCNVVAAFYHDHIFVDKKDVADAMLVLTAMQAAQI